MSAADTHIHSAHEFIAYLRRLRPEEWDVKVTDKWTVKDVVAHMVGWEKDDPAAIRNAWETKQLPWFYATDAYDEFNKRSVEFYRDYAPHELLEE